MEMSLAEAALRSGAANEFEQHIQALETRYRRIPNCTPRVIGWLVTFTLEIIRATQRARAASTKIIYPATYPQ